MQIILKVASEDRKQGEKNGRAYDMTILTCLDGGTEQPKCSTVFEVTLSDADIDLRGKLESKSYPFNVSSIGENYKGKVRLHGRFARQQATK